MSKKYNDLKSYCSGYLQSTVITGTITPGAPVLVDISGIQEATCKGFEASATGLKYTGDNTVIVYGTASISTSASLNNTVISYFSGLNGTVNLTTEIKRKIGTGGDLGAVSLTFSGQLSTNDVLNLFVDSTLGGTVTIENFVFAIKNVTI